MDARDVLLTARAATRIGACGTASYSNSMPYAGRRCGTPTFAVARRGKRWRSVNVIPINPRAVFFGWIVPGRLESI